MKHSFCKVFKGIYQKSHTVIVRAADDMLLGVFIGSRLAVMSELGDHAERAQCKIMMGQQCRWNGSSDITVKVEHRIGALIIDQVFGPFGVLRQQIDHFCVMRTARSITIAAKRDVFSLNK